MVCSMPDPRIEACVVDGLIPKTPGAPWRWIGSNSHYHFDLWSGRKLAFFARFAVVESNLKALGPITVKAGLNGRPLAEGRFDTPGIHELTARVPAELAARGGPVEVAVAIDPVITTDDGSKLGVLLFSIGFRTLAE